MLRWHMTVRIRDKLMCSLCGIPPFLIREASLFLDETPKFQSTNLSQNNHTIYDDETGMRIHLQLSGTFSYFPTRKLTEHEEEHCDEYPIVYLTPDSDQWDPQSSHYAEAEAAMIDHEGDIAQHDRKVKTVFNEADIARFMLRQSHVLGSYLRRSLMLYV